MSQLILTLHSLGLREINGVAYPTSKGQNELEAQVYLFPKPGPLGEQNTSMGAVNRDLLEVTMVTYLILTGVNARKLEDFSPQVIRTLKAPQEVSLGAYKLN